MGLGAESGSKPPTICPCNAVSASRLELKPSAVPRPSESGLGGRDGTGPEPDPDPAPFMCPTTPSKSEGVWRRGGLSWLCLGLGRRASPDPKSTPNPCPSPPSGPAGDSASASDPSPPAPLNLLASTSSGSGLVPRSGLRSGDGSGVGAGVGAEVGLLVLVTLPKMIWEGKGWWSESHWTEWVSSSM